MAVVAAIGYGLIGSVGGAALFAVAAYVLTYLSILLHELGHFLAAAAAGIHVAAMSVGGGPRARAFRLSRTFLILSPFPSEGLIQTVYESTKNLRRKRAFIVAAGPLTNAACAIPGLYLLFNSGNYGFGEHTEIGLALWVGINVLMALGNLWPSRTKTSYGELPSDGAQLWALTQMTEEELGELPKARHLTLALLEYQFGDKSAALSIIRNELKGGDPPVNARTLVTAILAETGQLEKGIEAGREFLRSGNVAPMEKAQLQNNLAYTLFLTGDPAHLEEADALSSSAMEALPMILAVRSTRGSVLVAAGRYQEGVDLLTDKRFGMESRSHRATVASMRARGLACLGKPEPASKSLKAAHALDPANPQLAAAREAVAAATNT